MSEIVASISQLVAEIDDWARQTRSIFDVATRLVAHFGTETEEATFTMATARARHWITATQRSVEGTALQEREPRRGAFSCTEEVAQMVSPMFVLLLDVEPSLTYTARQVLASRAGTVLRSYGAFLCSIDADICRPMWRAYPRLAPEGLVL